MLQIFLHNYVFTAAYIHTCTDTQCMIYCCMITAVCCVCLHTSAYDYMYITHSWALLRLATWLVLLLRVSFQVSAVLY